MIKNLSPPVRMNVRIHIRINEPAFQKFRISSAFVNHYYTNGFLYLGYMDRKNFLRVLASIPLLNIPFRMRGGNNKGACKTQRDAEGPFYKENAPMRSIIETKGDKLLIRGTVYSSTNCDTPLADVVLDIWHCDDEGNYDLKGYRGRGQVKTDRKGNYAFTTIYPPPYGNRPRHIHFKVKASGREQLTTQLYFDGDPNIKNDFARNAEKNRVIRLTDENDVRTGVFNIYV